MGGVEAARANLQTILDNLDGRCDRCSTPQGACRRLNPGRPRASCACRMAVYVGPRWPRYRGCRSLPQAVQSRFDAYLRYAVQCTGCDHWQQVLELLHSTAQAAQAATTAPTWWCGAPNCRCVRLLVFDDISEIVSAQRTQAWGEVARRVAARNQEPAHAHPALGRAAGALAQRQAAPIEQAILTKSVQDHRGPGGCDEATW